LLLPPSQQLAISRHASARGGFLFHLRLFEIAWESRIGVSQQILTDLQPGFRNHRGDGQRFIAIERMKS